MVLPRILLTKRIGTLIFERYPFEFNFNLKTSPTYPHEKKAESYSKYGKFESRS